MQETRLLALALADGDETLTDLPGERPPLPAASLTRVGEAERKFGIDRTGPLGRLAAAVAMTDRRVRETVGMEVLVSLLVVAWWFGFEQTEKKEAVGGIYRAIRTFS
jgi:hypothetical protein